MQDLIALGTALLALILLLFGSLLIAARIYIHRFQRWMDESSSELKAIREELDLLKGEVHPPSEAP